MKKKTYGKPHMAMEKFVPNEFVAACLLHSMIPYNSGVLCFDKNNNEKFDPYEDAGTGTYYEGVLENAITFEVLYKGRKVNESGALAFYYVGSSSFDYNMQPHIDDGTASTYYNYLGSNFIKCYYAKLKVTISQYDIREVDILMRESCMEATSNAS